VARRRRRQPGLDPELVGRHVVDGDRAAVAQGLADEAVARPMFGRGGRAVEREPGRQARHAVFGQVEGADLGSGCVGQVAQGEIAQLRRLELALDDLDERGSPVLQPPLALVGQAGEDDLVQRTSGARYRIQTAIPSWVR
jgi:hypothetical protein